MKTLAALTAVAIVLGLIVLVSALYTVTEFEHAIVTEFGKPVRTVAEAGLYPADSTLKRNKGEVHSRSTSWGVR